MPTKTDSAALISCDPTILRSIKQEDCSLAIWERSSLLGIEQLLDGAPQNIRLNSALSDLSLNLANALVTNGFVHSHIHGRLVDDANDLAELYCSILGINELELRLEFVSTDSCRKFHADFVTARLITTYIGAGSNWLNGEDADRVKAGLEPKRINSLTAGDVGIFKGKLALGRPAIHRSPPIAGTGQRRLLLVLNPVEKI